jgi:hypothetical protein
MKHAVTITPGFAALRPVQEVPMLDINPEKVHHIATQARMFDVKEASTDPDSGSNATDDAMVDVLDDLPDDAGYQEFAAFIRGLDEDEQIALVALAWVGRGTYAAAEWEEALAEASHAHNSRTVEYLTSLPMLGDYLEEGLALIEAGDDEVGDGGTGEPQ